MSTNTNLNYIKFLKESGISFFLQNKPKKFYKENKSSNITLTKSIDEINSIQELEYLINQSDVCKLKKNAKHTVFSDGNFRSKVMLIGEAPGAEEDIQGKPFVGQAGQLLNKMLAAIGLDRKTVYITNVLPWRPPNNRTPNSEEILQCLPFIQKHIELINPNMLILLGGTAAKAILTSSNGIMKLRGRWHKYNSLYLKKSILTRAIYHPAFLLRSPTNKKEAWEDLQEIQKKLKDNENI